MKIWYMVGPDLSMTDGIHCSYFDEPMIFMGLTTNKHIAIEYAKQYEHFVYFKIIKFKGPDDYNDPSFPIMEALRSFGILDVSYISDLPTDIDLIEGNVNTIHPSSFIFTMLQYDAYMEECAKGLDISYQIDEVTTKIASLHILSKYIRDNDDIANFIIRLMVRCLALSKAPCASYYSNDRHIVESLLSLIGYSNDDIILDHFISIEKMLEEYMLRWDAEY